MTWMQIPHRLAIWGSVVVGAKVDAGTIIIGQQKDLAIGRGAANRLDLASGDRLRLHTTGGTIEFGSTDVGLYRHSTGKMGVTGDIRTPTSGSIELGSTDVALYRKSAGKLGVTGDVRLATTGTVELGSTDVALFRSGAGVLGVTGHLNVAASAGELQISTDTAIARDAANQLTTADRFRATPINTQGGSALSANGDFGLSGSTFYYRVSGTVYYCTPSGTIPSA